AGFSPPPDTSPSAFILILLHGSYIYSTQASELMSLEKTRKFGSNRLSVRLGTIIPISHEPAANASTRFAASLRRRCTVWRNIIPASYSFFPQPEPTVPILHPPGSGQQVGVLESRSTFKVTSAQTGGAYAVLEQLIPPGGGPPLHVHRHETEIFY